MMSIEKIEVSTEVYEKVKEWLDAGRTVYRTVCLNLGCLREHYVPESSLGCACLACRLPTAKDGDLIKRIDSLEMLEPKEFVPVKITQDDIQVKINLTYCVPHPLELHIEQHWRPALIGNWEPSVCDMDGLLDGGEEYSDEEYEKIYDEELKEFIDSLEDGSYVEENWLYLETVCQRMGYELVKERKEEDA